MWGHDIWWNKTDTFAIGERVRMDAMRFYYRRTIRIQKSLGVLNNYVSSLASNIDDNIEKARKKAGMIFFFRL